jgi:hypothetical protein
MKIILIIIFFSTFSVAQEDSTKTSMLKSPSIKSQPDSSHTSNPEQRKSNRMFIKKGKSEETDLTPTGWYFGYLGNLLNAPFGLTFGIISKGIGFYFSYVTSFKDFTEENFYENISEEEARDIFVDTQTDEDFNYQGYSLGTVISIYQRFKIYGGLTLFKQTHYLRFYDKFQILGDNGSYWIKTSKDNEIFSFNLGLFYFFSDTWYLQVGRTFKPSGFELGVGVIF